MVIKAFRIRIASFDRRKIIFDYFDRGDDKRRAFSSPIARLVRAFFTLDREFLLSVLFLSILFLLLLRVLLTELSTVLLALLITELFSIGSPFLFTPFGSAFMFFVHRLHTTY